MGGSKKQTVGYWYRPVIHLGLHQGPFDALLRVRGGDVDAWQGEMTSSGTLQVNAPEIWGGEDSEGGMVGEVDVMFGEADQQPNAYFQSAVGPDPSGHRGIATLLWKGGRYGAMNPYPKPISVMTRRVLKGWDRDVCWFPETAEIPMGAERFSSPTSLYIALDRSGSMAGTRLQTLKDGMSIVLDTLASWISQGAPLIHLRVSSWASNEQSIERMSLNAAGIEDVRAFVNAMVASGGTDAPAAFGAAHEFLSRSGLSNRVVVCVSDGAMSNVAAAQASLAAAADDLGAISIRGIGIGTAGSLASFDNSGGPVPVISGQNAGEMADVILAAMASSFSFIGMNPAHAIYDSLVDPRMQGEPVELINDASFRRAALRLRAEVFGICTFYDPDQETVEQFRQRLCDLIGAQCSRSTVDGQWYLDLIRGDYDITTLPVLTDDDILEFQDDPSVLDDAVNQVAVQWFDPLTKQDRITAPVHSLGAVQAMGTIVAETNSYPEIPVESLAERLAARDLRNKSTPLWRKTIKTNRTPYAWRIGTQFRLQAPRHGVADMVCMVGELDKGTLRSGAISLVALQDIFGMPDAAYVVGQPSVQPANRTPQPSPAQRMVEAPYTELAAVLGAADLQALDATTGYLLVMGARPEGSASYQLQVSASGGGYDEAGIFEWCPVAITADEVDALATNVTLTSAELLDRVSLGTAALWGDEIVRVDAKDTEALVLTLGRGCADTVPVSHAAGTRIWFYDEWSGSDGQAYIEGEQVSAKLLTRTGSATLAVSSAPASTLVMAGRALRPYPPGRVKVGESAGPLVGSFTVTWAHRDRVLQGDQLIDTSLPSITPDPATRYGMRVLDAQGAVLAIRENIAGDQAIVRLAYTGDIRLELWALNDTAASWQRHVALRAYTAEAGTTGNTITAPAWTPDDTAIIIDGGEIT